MEEIRNHLRKESPKVCMVTDGIILPRQMAENGPRWGLGGVCDSNNQFVEESYYDGGWATQGGYYEWNDDEEEYIDEEAVYIGLFFPHWGHFIIDQTTRLWPLPLLCKEQGTFKVAFLGEEMPQNNFLRFFELLGIQKEQLLQIKKPTRFRKVLIPEQSFKSCEWYTREFVEMFDHIVEKVLQGSSETGINHREGKVYFTRRELNKAASSEFGEKYFEKRFIRDGFQSRAPEKLSLDEQIRFWNNTSHIACLNGSIPLSVVFCTNPELRLIVLNKTSIEHRNPYIIMEMRNLSVEYLPVWKEPIKGYPKSLGRGPYLLWPTKAFSEYCKRVNMKEGPKITKIVFGYYFICYLLAIIRGRIPKSIRESKLFCSLRRIKYRKRKG